MNTINAMWEAYRRMMLVPDACAEDVDAARLVFHGGASSVLRLLNDQIGVMSAAAGAAMLTGLFEEIREFMRQEAQRRFADGRWSAAEVAAYNQGLADSAPGGTLDA